MPQKFKRKNYFISPKYQLKYIITMVSAVLGSGLLMSAGVYVTIYMMIQKLIPDSEDAKLVFNSVFHDAGIYLACIFPLVLLVVVIVSIFISHKISGPEYRLKNSMEAMRKGDLTVGTSLRDGDELRALSEKLGELRDTYRRLIVGYVKSVSQAKGKAVKLNKGKTSGIQALLEKDLTKLEAALKKFKIK